MLMVARSSTAGDTGPRREKTPTIPHIRSWSLSCFRIFALRERCDSGKKSRPSGLIPPTSTHAMTFRCARPNPPWLARLPPSSGFQFPAVAARRIKPEATTQPRQLFWSVTETPDTHPEPPQRKSLLRSVSLKTVARWLLIGVASAWLLAALTLVAARWIDPPTTAVHMQRRFQAWIHNKPYHERYTFVPLSQIRPISSTPSSPRRTGAFTSIMGSIGTRFKSLPRTIWRAAARAERPP